MMPIALWSLGVREVRSMRTRPTQNRLEVDYLPPFGRSEVTIIGPAALPVAIVAVCLAAVLASELSD